MAELRALRAWLKWLVPLTLLAAAAVMLLPASWAPAQHAATILDAGNIPAPSRERPPRSAAAAAEIAVDGRVQPPDVPSGLTDEQRTAEQDNNSPGGGTVAVRPGDLGERSDAAGLRSRAPAGELAWDEAESAAGDACSLDVSVAYEDGRPAVDVLVHIHREERWNTMHVARVRTTGRGRARVVGLPVSYYRIGVEVDDALAQSKSWRCDGGEAGEVSVLLRAEHDARIFGRVTDANTDQPIAGARVTIQELTRAETAADFTRPTVLTVDDAGRFDAQVRGGNSWPYRLFAGAPGYHFESVDVHVVSGRHRRVFLRLRPDAALAGRVLRPDGSPATGIEVHQHGPGSLVGTSTDARGAFFMSTTPHKNVTVFAAGGDSYAQLPVAPLEEGETRSGLVLRLGPGRTIEGGVVDEAGNPVGFVGVVAGLRRGGLVGQTSADHEGKFIMDGVPPGALQMFASGSRSKTGVPCEDASGTCDHDVDNVTLTFLPW